MPFYPLPTPIFYTRTPMITKRVTVRAVVNYVHLTPIRRPSERKAYYRVDVIIPMSDTETLSRLRESVRAADETCTLPEVLKIGDLKGSHLYSGCYYFTAKRSVDLAPPKVTGTPRDGASVDITLRAMQTYRNGERTVSFRLESIDF